MRDLSELNQYRIHVPEMDRWAEFAEGLFKVPSTIDRRFMNVIASASYGWDHVSVSRSDRVPNWYEMQQVKRLFFKPDEVVMQLHPADQNYITGAWPGKMSLNVLHMWRPHPPLFLPTPPRKLVGANSKEEWLEIMK